MLACIFLFYIANVFERTSWGNPLLLHPDESTVVRSAYLMARNHTLLPDVFAHPDHLEIMLNFLVGTILSPICFGTTYGSAFEANLFFFDQVGRCITLTFGVGTLLLAYRIGERFHRAAGIPCAALFALFPLYMDNAYFATPDIPLTCMVMLTVLFAMRYLDHPGYASLIGMCLSTAASIAVKYPGAISAILIAAVVVAKSPKQRRFLHVVKKGAFAAGVTTACLFLISPVLFLRFDAVLSNLKNESRVNHPGADGLGFVGNAAFYLSLLYHSMGWFFLAVAAVGLFLLIRRRQKYGLVLLISPVYWVALSAIPIHWDRWSLPMMIAPLLLAGYGIPLVYAFLQKATRPKLFLTSAFTAALAVMLTNQAVTDLTGTKKALLPDTRQIALDYCNQHGITPDNTASDGYTPFLPGTYHDLSDDVKPVSGTIAPCKASSRQTEYVIVSSGMYDRFYAKPGLYTREVQVYRTIRQNCRSIARFDAVPFPHSNLTLVNIAEQVAALVDRQKIRCAGPTIVIYRVEAPD